MTRTGVTALTMISTVCLVVLFATACGKSEDSKTPATATATTTAATATGTATPTTAAPADAPTSTISGNKCTDIIVPPGAEITVKNADSAEHSVTSDTPGEFEVEVEVHGSNEVTFTAPSQPGTYPFHCTYHPSMKGVLTVQ